MLDLERDVPTSSEDIEVLRRLRADRPESALMHLRRLVPPDWTLALAADRPTFEGFAPFTLSTD